MRVVILGYGRVGQLFSKAFQKAGIDVAQVYNRSRISIANLKTISSLDKLITDADLYLICVSDDAISGLASKLTNRIAKKSIIAHTSGSVRAAVLESVHKKYASFYPLQSITVSRLDQLKDYPILITGSSKKVEKQLLDLAAQITKRSSKISDDDKIKIHLPAVLVNNFTNHMMAHAYDYCKQEKLPFDMLLPLIRETIDRLEEKEHPAKHQTGPAIRGDKSTLKRHRSQLSKMPYLKKLYNYITSSIKDYHENRR